VARRARSASACARWPRAAHIHRRLFPRRPGGSPPSSSTAAWPAGPAASRSHPAAGYRRGVLEQAGAIGRSAGERPRTWPNSSTPAGARDRRALMPTTARRGNSSGGWRGPGLPCRCRSLR
jgi:hypothetical protein